MAPATCCSGMDDRQRGPDLFRSWSVRTALYVRISLDSTSEGLGVQRQEEDARAIIERAAERWPASTFTTA